jgi:hypothetical protein
MNLYLVSNLINVGYDTYDRAVVVASDEAEAIWVARIDNSPKDWWYNKDEGVTVELLGTALGLETRLVCAEDNREEKR